MNLLAEAVGNDKVVRHVLWGFIPVRRRKKNLQYIRIWFRDYARFREEFGYVENL